MGVAPRLAAAFALLVGLIAAPALAVPQPPAAVADSAADDADIVVVGDNGSSYRLTGDALRDAAQAFNANRAAYAPGSQLFFEVIPAGGVGLADVAMYLRARGTDSDGRHAHVDLMLDRDGRFVLPTDVVINGRWDLSSTSPRGSIRVRPVVLSHGSSIADRRFGDLRLQCRVFIAFARLSLPMRALAGAAGVCNNSHIALYTRAPRPLSAVTISGYARPIDIRGDLVSYRVPLHDQSIGNEARMRLTYR